MWRTRDRTHQNFVIVEDEAPIFLLLRLHVSRGRGFAIEKVGDGKTRGGFAVAEDEKPKP